MVSKVKKIKVAAYTGGLNVPSSRFRVRQLIPHLASNEVLTHEFISPISKYPPANKLLRPFWGAAILPLRVPHIIAGQFYDVTLLQREFVSTLYTLEGLTAKPRVLDVDDAIFLRRNGKFAEKLAKNSDLVICGNAFLAEQFSQWNGSITILPTSVDSDIFFPDNKNTSRPVIGWIGSCSNLRYLKKIEVPLAKVLNSFPDVLLRIVTDGYFKLPLLPIKQVEFIPWSAKLEVEMINSFTVGIMPLDNGNWERGKCSFKMLQYMSCGVPVLVSPVGMNRDVLRMGEIGIGAETDDDWVGGLEMLLQTPEIALNMGLNGRKVVIEHFSTKIIARQLSALLRGVM